MLSFLDPSVRGSRRDFLRIGGLSLGGLTLTDWLRMEAAAVGKPLATDKSVVFLFMQGGPSQIETFDPKMTAPTGVHSINGEVQTKLPGVTICSGSRSPSSTLCRVCTTVSFAAITITGLKLRPVPR